MRTNGEKAMKDSDKLHCVECEADLPITRKDAREMDRKGPQDYTCPNCGAVLDVHELSQMFVE
jgi:predicted RNA-binding Zn-ribbon protein involved in translation (DUF1610 family)